MEFHCDKCHPFLYGVYGIDVQTADEPTIIIKVPQYTDKSNFIYCVNNSGLPFHILPDNPYNLPVTPQQQSIKSNPSIHHQSDI